MPPDLTAIERAVASWPGVSAHEHEFGGVEFRLADHEIGHTHKDGVVDISFTLSIRDALLHSDMAERHAYVPNSGWATTNIGKRGAAHVMKLLRLAYLRLRVFDSNKSIADAAAEELYATWRDEEVLKAITTPNVQIVRLA